MKKSISSIICMFMGIVCCISMLAVGIAAAVGFRADFSISLTFTNENLICKVGLAIYEEEVEIVEEEIIFDNTIDDFEPLGTIVSNITVDANNRTILTLGSVFGTPTSDNDFVFTFYSYDTLNTMIATCSVSGVNTRTENGVDIETDNLLGYTVMNSIPFTSTNAPNSTQIISTCTEGSEGTDPIVDSETLRVNAQAHTEGRLHFAISIDTPFTLTHTLSNLTTSNNNNGIVGSYDYKTTLTPATNYTLPTTLTTITCNGNPLQTAIIASNVYEEGTNEYYYNFTTGELIIFKEAITGNIVIGASGV